MDKKPNEIYENLIPTKYNNHIVQYKLLYVHVHITTNTNIPYNWPAFIAAFWLNSGYTSSYALIRIHY